MSGPAATPRMCSVQVAPGMQHPPRHPPGVGIMGHGFGFVGVGIQARHRPSPTCADSPARLPQAKTAAIRCRTWRVLSMAHHWARFQTAASAKLSPRPTPGEGHGRASDAEAGSPPSTSQAFRGRRMDPAPGTVLADTALHPRRGRDPCRDRLRGHLQGRICGPRTGCKAAYPGHGSRKRLERTAQHPVPAAPTDRHRPARTQPPGDARGLYGKGPGCRCSA